VAASRDSPPSSARGGCCRHGRAGPLVAARAVPGPGPGVFRGAEGIALVAWHGARVTGATAPAPGAKGAREGPALRLGAVPTRLGRGGSSARLPSGEEEEEEDSGFCRNRALCVEGELGPCKAAARVLPGAVASSCQEQRRELDVPAVPRHPPGRAERDRGAAWPRSRGCVDQEPVSLGSRRGRKERRWSSRRSPDAGLTLALALAAAGDW